MTKLERAIDGMPEDFRMLDVLAEWDGQAQKTREAQDRERRERQQNQEDESERLFADSQIGYGELNARERQFMEAEAQRKKQELSREYESFAQSVFEPTYAKLQDQITYLMDRSAVCVDLMNRAALGKRAVEEGSREPDLARTIDLFLMLHRKIEGRHHGVLAVVLERDRRFKQTIMQPLQAAGKVSDTKEMEKHFDDAEKKAGLEAATKKQERATLLAGTVQGKVVEGLGQDLDYMDTLSQEVRRTAETMAVPTVQPEPDDVDRLADGLERAKGVLQTLAGTCKRLMHGGHVATLALSTAKYDASAAAARQSGRGVDELRALRATKQREDDTSTKEYEGRVATVQGDMERALAQTSKLAARLTELAHRPTRDLEHEERIKKALDAAKKRNAAKEGTR